MKSDEEYFCDWENEVFGLGYGTGDVHTLTALKTFFEVVPSEGPYDYTVIENDITPAAAWLLINILMRTDTLEYGTSTRFGWLTDEGRRMKEFLASKTVDELYEITQTGAIPCSSTGCNCGPNGYEEGRVCQNPFWNHD